MSVVIGGKAYELPLLKAELAAAGINVSALGSVDNLTVITYSGTGDPVALPAGAAAVLAAHVAPPPITNYTAAIAMSGRLRTTTATATELYRATLRTLTGYRALATLLAVDAGNGDLRQIYASMVVKRLAGGAVLVGAPVVLANHQDAGASAWAITASVSGNDFVITVAGSAGRTVDWLLDGQIISFTPGGV